MKLFRLAAWVAWFTLAWAGAAHAGPVVAAITAVGGWLGSTALGKLVLGLALQVGSSLLQKAMQKKQAEPGITGQVQLGGTNSLSFIIGSYATAGQLEFIATHGRVGKTPNALLAQVVTVSDLPVNAISNNAWIDGAQATRNTSIAGQGSAKFGPNSFPFNEYLLDGWHFLFATYRLGNQTTADPNLVAANFGAERPWHGDMVGRGLAQVILNAEVKRELFKGFPAGRWQVDGIRLYDPRLDSTVGGSGSQRWGQEGTYAFSNNPAVMIYNILRGIYYQGEWVYGPEIPGLALPLSNWFAAMNECDRPIALAGGGSERQFRAGYEIKTAEMEPADVIEELLTACNGRIAEIGGTYKIHVGAPALPVYFFTDDDIEVLNSPQSFDPFPGFENTFNGVDATYPEPSIAWEMKDAPLYVNPVHVAADGEQRLAEVAYNAVPYASQVQRLMRSTAEDNRRFRRHQITLPPEAWLLEPLDSVSWTSNRNGYDAKVFPITAMEDLDNCNQTVSLHEADPTDYDWSPSFELPWSVGSLTPNRPPAQLLTGWQVEPATIFDEQGRARRPSIQVYFDGDLEDIREVRIVVRLFSSKAVVFDALLPYGEPSDEIRSVVLNGVFLPDELYEVSGILIPFGGRTMQWSEWLVVRTPDVRLGDADVFLPGVEDQINESVENAKRFTGVEAREARENARRLAMYGLEQDGANALDKQELRESLTARAGALEASYDNVVTLIVTQDQAIAQRFEEVTATIDGKASTSAVDAVSARVDTFDSRITAVTERQIATESQVGNFYAGGLIRMRQVASEDGALSTVAISAAASEGGADSQAVVVLNALAGGLSEIGLIADRTYLRSGSNKARPMVFENGVLIADELNVNFAKVTGTLDGNRINARTLAADRLVLGGITHTEIQNGAITSATLYDQSSDITPAQMPAGQIAPATTVAQSTISGVAGRLRQISFSCFIRGQWNAESSPSTINYGVQILRGGTILRTITVPVMAARRELSGGTFTNNYATEVSANMIDYGGGASQTYTVRIGRQSFAETSASHSVSERFMVISEYRA